MARASVVTRVLEDVADEVRVLERVPLLDMIPVLQQARAEAAAGLRQWLAAVKDGEARFTAQQYRNAIAQLDTALATIEELEPATVKGLTRANDRAKALAPDHVQRELSAFSSHFGGSVNPVPFREASQIRKGDKTLMRRFATSAARYADAVGNDIRRELAVGLVKGETMDQLKARLIRHGGPRGTIALQGIASQPGAVTEVISDGLFRKYGYWAERIARTEVLNAYNVHADESIADVHKLDPKIQRIWNGTADRRTCPICRGLDGKVAAVGKPFEGGYEYPPAHPNCRCTVAAWRSDWN